MNRFNLIPSFVVFSLCFFSLSGSAFSQDPATMEKAGQKQAGQKQAGQKQAGQKQAGQKQAGPETDAGKETQATQENQTAELDFSQRGLSKEKPETGKFVEVEGGYMVEFNQRIPGTDVSFTMIPVPGGTFMMGSPEDETGHRDDEGPQVEVVVEPFWMGKYEVTWAEYQTFMKLTNQFKDFNAKKVRPITDENRADTIAAPSRLYDPTFTFEPGDGDNEPAATMTQFAAKQYTKYLSLLCENFYRLPTEAEWEYACRAGTTTAYYFGDDPAELKNHGWFYDNADEYRSDVGQFPANPFGLHDMYGNVSEWVLDGYTEDGYKRLAKNKSTTQQAYNAPKTSYGRICRGGNFCLEAEDCRSASRQVSKKEWKKEDPNVPKSPWWHTGKTDVYDLWENAELGVGFRIFKPLRTPETRAAKESFWELDNEDISDAIDAKYSKGAGEAGLVTPDLPKAIEAFKSRENKK